MRAIELKSLEPYEDELGNRIEVSGDYSRIRFHLWLRGRNNRLVIAPGTRLKRLTGAFDGNEGLMTIGAHTNLKTGSWHFRVGEQSAIKVGHNVSCTQYCILSAVEGTTLTIGDDCMIAEACAVRADDAHAIYDVHTGTRVNVSKDVTLENHVWLGFGATVLSGVRIGRGSVVGTQSVVTRSVPNNCIAAGNPARVIRENIAWERPHLSLEPPAFRPDDSVITRSEYWDLTEPILDPKVFGASAAPGTAERLRTWWAMRQSKRM